MFGLKSASENYQKVLQGCEGAQNISDDIIVHGTDRAQHDERLRKVLQRICEKGLPLNKDKCQFCMTQLVFMGHVLSDQGVSIEDAKVQAVKNDRKLENAAEVRSFLGLVNFSAKFIPNLATISEPLRRLTRKSVPFSWQKEHSEAFTKLKEVMTNTKTLADFYRSARTQVIADTSPVGSGAVLVQEQRGEMRVICYASRSLSDVERRYSTNRKRKPRASVGL